MNIDSIKKVELEITSNCNAACPGCARTQNSDILEIHSFGLADLMRMFPTPRHIQGKEFKFCGVLGDPIANKECYDMIEYLVSNNGYCQISTNGGLNSASWWTKLGELSKKTNLVDVNFCVDGHKETNHIYRVITLCSVIEKNMTATTGTKEHSKKDLVKDLDKFISTYNKGMFMIPIVDKKQEILNSITCKLVHEGEIFIASNQTMWPCCFLWDSMFKNKESIVEKLNEYSEGWNSLRNHSIDEILAHPWFNHILAESWNPNHAKHFIRCIRTCAYNKAYQNEINYVDKKTT